MTLYACGFWEKSGRPKSCRSSSSSWKPTVRLETDQLIQIAAFQNKEVAASAESLQTQCREDGPGGDTAGSALLISAQQCWAIWAQKTVIQ